MKSYTLLFSVWLCISLLAFPFHSRSQDVSFKLSDAVAAGLHNYQNISAKRNYMKASAALVQNARNKYLPDITASIQQAYGTVNGQLGVAGSFAGGAGISSSGPAYTSQSWNTAFGSVYLVNTNWEFISFGRLRSRIAASNRQFLSDSANLDQEKFVAGVRIAGA